MSNQIFVGNLSWDATENDLNDLFAQYGEVVTVNIMTDRETSKPRGFGFVTMAAPDAARSAIEALNGRELHGRKLTVNEAKPKESGGGGGGGGGYGRGGGGGGYGRDRTDHGRQGGRGGGGSFSSR